MRRTFIHAITLAASAAIMIPASADAQQRPERRAVAGAPVERLIEQREKLGLTDQQVEQLRRIGAELQQKNAPLVAQLEKHRAEMPRLTDEQRAEMQTRREAMRDSLRQRAGTITPERRDSIRERARQMTAEQREQMRSTLKEHRQGARPGAHPQMPQELRTAMEQLRTNTQSAMQQVQATLTPEQQQKLRELRPARRPVMRGPRPPRADGEMPRSGQRRALQPPRTR